MYIKISHYITAVFIHGICHFRFIRCAIGKSWFLTRIFMSEDLVILEMNDLIIFKKDLSSAILLLLSNEVKLLRSLFLLLI